MHESTKMRLRIAKKEAAQKTCARVRDVIFSSKDAVYRFCTASREAISECKNCNIDDIPPNAKVDTTLISRHIRDKELKRTTEQPLDVGDVKNPFNSNALCYGNRD